MGDFDLWACEDEVSDRVSEIRLAASSENLEIESSMETGEHKFPTSIMTNQLLSDDGSLGLAVGGFSASPRGDDQLI